MRSSSGASAFQACASELVSGLSELAKRCEIVRSPSGRWQNVAPQQPSSNPDPDRSASGPSDGTVLYAVRATWDPLPQMSGSDERADKWESGEPGSPRLPPWPRLASYYAATQRKDPRGTIAEFSDRHGQCWQLLQMRGAWWDDAVLLGEQLLQAGVLTPFISELLKGENGLTGIEKLMPVGRVGEPEEVAAAALFLASAMASMVTGHTLPFDG